MTIHLRREVSDRDVPMEFMKLALSYLEAAERLNSLMLEKAWPSNYYRGQAVLLLTFHAVELFLKGFILKLAPRAKVDGHSLAALTNKLKGLASDIEFDPPFKVEALTPFLVLGAEAKEKKFHEVLRYPINKKGKPWPGVRGFSTSSCNRMLKRVRADCERLYVRVFGR
ncbi:MAG: hypothetical protein HZB54_01790 [Deltaproteobacteria bacterium]|nr:hypothetical protein [Deltaproteobacteria bacterium]